MAVKELVLVGTLVLLMMFIGGPSHVSGSEELLEVLHLKEHEHHRVRRFSLIPLGLGGTLATALVRLSLDLMANLPILGAILGPLILILALILAPILLILLG